LENKKREIYAKAWEKSAPKIEQLRKQITDDVKKYTELKLNKYFQKLEKRNVDKFLDWLYSFGTDYKITFFSSKEEVEKFLSSRKCLEEGANRCQNLVKPSGYLEEQISKYLLNPENLENYLKREIFPYHRQKLEEFVNKSYEILEEEIERTAKAELKRKFPNLGEGEIEEFIKGFMVDVDYKLRANALERISGKVAVGVIWVVMTKSVLKVVKALPKKVATKIASKIAGKIAAKMATKAGSKLAGVGSAFAVGTGLCMEFGPLAVICGATAAAVATFATDYAVNRLDEFMNRDDFKRELIKHLEDSEKELYSEVVKNFENTIKGVEAEMGKNFAGQRRLKEIPLLEKGD